MAARRNAPATRARILDAAEQVLVREGPGGLSIDAVVAGAQVSKGGFFHHFESREALLDAVMERLTAHLGEALAAAVAAGPPAPGAAQRAQVALAFELPEAERRRSQALVLALVEAARHSPGLATRSARALRRSVAEAAAEGLDEGDALVVQLALDGYWLGEALGTLGLGGRQRAALRRSLERLTR